VELPQLLPVGRQHVGIALHERRPSWSRHMTDKRQKQTLNRTIINVGSVALFWGVVVLVCILIGLFLIALFLIGIVVLL
jgi:hypothetical protein